MGVGWGEGGYCIKDPITTTVTSVKNKIQTLLNFAVKWQTVCITTGAGNCLIPERDYKLLISAMAELNLVCEDFHLIICLAILVDFATV